MHNNTVHIMSPKRPHIAHGRSEITHCTSSTSTSSKHLHTLSDHAQVPFQTSPQSKQNILDKINRKMHWFSVASSPLFVMVLRSPALLSGMSPDRDENVRWLHLATGIRRCRQRPVRHLLAQWQWEQRSSL